MLIFQNTYWVVTKNLKKKKLMQPAGPFFHSHAGRETLSLRPLVYGIIDFSTFLSPIYQYKNLLKFWNEYDFWTFQYFFYSFLNFLKQIQSVYNQFWDKSFSEQYKIKLAEFFLQVTWYVLHNSSLNKQNEAFKY